MYIQLQSIIKRTVLFFGIFLFALVLIAESCTTKKESPLSNNGEAGNNMGGVTNNSCTYKFSTDVNPIIKTYCATNSGCHGVGSAHPFTNYSHILVHAQGIKSSVQNKSMPRGSSLSQEDIDKISCWVSGGAPNN